MPTDRANAGDPDRTLALLWRDPAALPRRGPRQGLSVDRVVSAAVGLADREGLDKLAMRRVADELGVAAMTLYTYVPGKAELLDLMLDAGYATMARTDTTGRPWRERVAAVAGENRELLRAHPWIVGVATGRPSLGPGQMAKYEHELHAFDGLGLDDVRRDHALAHLLAFVRAQAQADEEDRRAVAESGIDDGRWWEVNAPLLARALDPAAYPLASRVGTAAGEHHGSARSSGEAWDFGLAVILDGLAALVGEPVDPSGR